MTSRKTGIPAKKAGAKPKSKAKKKGAAKKAAPAKPRAVVKLEELANTYSERTAQLAAAAMSAVNFSDQAEAEVLPHARLRRSVRDLLEASGAAAMVIPDHDGRVLAFGKPADLLQLLSHRVPKRVRYRDAITGLFVRAKEAFLRPKTTVREEDPR